MGEEVSQWASKVIGRSGVYQNKEVSFGAQLALGPASNGQHQNGWTSDDGPDTWIELGFDKEVIPTDFEIFGYNGNPMPIKIFGRGPANELIEVYNNPQILKGKGIGQGIMYDLIEVQTPMKQFRFEYSTAKNGYLMIAVRLIGILGVDSKVATKDTAINQLRAECDRALQEIATLKTQLAACQAAKAQVEQDSKKQQDASNRVIQEVKAQLAACQAAKAQVEQDAKVLQAKVLELQHKLNQQSIQGIMSNIDNATIQDVLTLAAFLQVDVSTVHTDKLAVAHILAFDSFSDFFDDSEADPSADQHDALLKLYATIKTAKDTQQLPNNLAVSSWIKKQPRHQDETIAKKIDEAALRFDEKGYNESMLYYLDPRMASAYLGIKPALVKSLQKDLIASRGSVHLMPMQTSKQ